MNKRRLMARYLFAQLLFILFISYNYLFSQFRLEIMFVVLLMFIETALNLFFMKETYKLLKIEYQAEINRIRFEQYEQIVQSLSSKHYDIVNHFRVIMDLIQGGKYDESVVYMRKLSHDLIQVEKLVTLKRPEVAAIISTKVTELNYMQLFLRIETDLEYLSVRPDKIVSILGNLLDNAIFEASRCAAKWVALTIYENKGWYFFEVSNPGYIPESIRDKIFDEGVTTKGDQGTGMGLFIVSKIVGELGGTIELTFPEENTIRFRIRLPIKQ